MLLWLFKFTHFYIKIAHLSILESAMCLLSAEKLRKKYHVHTTQSKQKYLSDFFVSDIILQNT